METMHSNRGVSSRITPFSSTATGNGNGSEPSIGVLFRQLTTDLSQLVQQEMQLAKLEIGHTTSEVMKDVTKIVTAAVVGLLAGFALLAFAIVALGDLLDNYWLSALLVGLVLLGVAAVMGKGAANHLKRHSVKPEATLQTLQQDVRWAKGEAREFSQGMRSSGHSW